jgi:hypothetical protein
MPRADNRGGTAFAREDMREAIADAISDSFDMDWTSGDGADAVLRECGVWELYEALERVRERLLGTPSVNDVIAALNIIDAALAKARGDA